MKHGCDVEWSFLSARRACSRLRFKTTALLACIVLGGTGLSAVLYVKLASDTLEREAHWRARELAHAVGIAASTPLATGDRATLVAIAQNLIPKHHLRYVAFADPAGRILAGAQGGLGHLSTLLYDGASAIPVDALDTPLLVMHEGEPRVDATAAVFADNGGSSLSANPPVVGYVRLGESLADTRAQVGMLTQRVCGIAALIALLMIPVGYWVVGRIAIPLRELRGASADWAAGQLDRRVLVSRDDEIGELTRDFNAMADQLSQARAAQSALNAELEDRVMARTFELSELNVRLRQEMAEKEDFLRTVSHDLNAPLRNVAGMIGLLRDRHGTLLTPDAEAMIERIDHNVRREIDLVNELLELAHLRTQRDPAQRVDLGAEVRNAAHRLEHDMLEKGISLDVPHPLPVVFAEKLRMSQLFTNLIDNAIKYTDVSRLPAGVSSPCVRVTCAHHPDSFEFRIADHGIGIEPRDRERLFYVFRRGKNPFVARTAGKGVGLASCKSIVQNYGGRIWVESNPNGGTIVCFTLARARLAAESRPPATVDSPGNMPLSATREQTPEAVA